MSDKIKICHIERGIREYADRDFIPALGGGGTAKKVILATAATIVCQRLSVAMERLRGNGLLAAMDIIDEDGMVDLPIVAESLKAQMGGDGLPLDVPMVGRIIFRPSDVDKIMDYVRASAAAEGGEPA